jgi:hypothetical protein
MGMERFIFLKKVLTMESEDLRGSSRLLFLGGISLLLPWFFITIYIVLTD